jgi:hypothetical protein
MAEPVICTYCGEELDEDELEHPYELDDKVVCDPCYRDHAFNCEICDNLVPNTEWNYFLLFKNDDNRLKPGVYKITCRPFFMSCCIGEDTIFTDRVEWVAELPDDLNEDSGREICDDCAKKLTGETL